MIEELVLKLEGWSRSFVLLLPNIAAALGTVAAFWLLSIGAARIVDRVTRRLSDHLALVNLVRKLVRFLVVGAGVVVALDILHLEKAATTFLAGAGILGLALGFAFQDISSNFIAGVAMALRRPMRFGDLVETNGFLGTVEEIHLRSTHLRTLQGQLVVIPNRKVFEEALTNYTQLGRRRVDLEVGISYGDDLDRARTVALEAVEGIERLPDRKVELFYRQFGSSSIDFVVRFWIPFSKQRDFLAAQSAAVMAIKRAFDAHDITIPFPIRTLDFGATGGERLRDHLVEWTERRPGAPPR